jgi:hypothetical protein
MIQSHKFMGCVWELRTFCHNVLILRILKYFTDKCNYFVHKEELGKACLVVVIVKPV